ncbi:hypothetical protein H6P81_019796 [Aristolochia fimbriata]|uniref:Uncharacterized protein n=1 Tax=Aristolochia fimbriata TaxID=158543 RepID=A0AAV7DVW9_ARIFI|nr:hypothetical protein H6P81_019796 [Aristolochia fimbriata]
MSDQPQQRRRPEPQEKRPESASDPSKLFGLVSHDELCDTITQQIQFIDEDDLFSISGTGCDTPKKQPQLSSSCEYQNV